MAIEAWEEQERRHKERQGVELPEKVRTSILFQLAPEKLSEEILKQATKWTSYTALKEHLQTLQHLRTSGPAPMLSNMEEDKEGDGETIVDENGELLRLERRNGQKVAVKTWTKPPFQRGGKGGGKGSAKECHGCGREGHFRRDCIWTKHKDGGPIRPIPSRPRRPAGNLEEGEEPGLTVDEDAQVGSLELMSLEPGLNSSGDEDSDQLSNDCEEEEFHEWME